MGTRLNCPKIFFTSAMDPSGGGEGRIRPGAAEQSNDYVERSMGVGQGGEENVPAPLVDDEAERQECHLLEGLCQEQADVSRAVRRAVEQADLEIADLPRQPCSSQDRYLVAADESDPATEKELG